MSIQILRPVLLLSFVLSLAHLAAPAAWAEVVGFDAGHWDLANARVVEHLERTALMGSATLKDVEFGDGVIEMDVAVTGARSYPGVMFRAQPDGSWERFYIRPHRSGRVPPSLYSDVLQYVASSNRVDSWQLYHGDGCTAGAVIPINQWFHVRIEVAGTRARVFLGDSQRPALRIHRLAHGDRSGGIGLMGPADGSAYFSNFSYRADTSLRFEPPPFRASPPGVIREWEISRSFRAQNLDLEKTPREQGLADLAWKPVVADASGLVDISRLYARSGGPDAVFARTTLHADKDRTLALSFGYSDIVSVFLDGRLLYDGNSRYQSRDQSFLGVVGFFDTVYLPLKRGDHELLLLVTEVSGGWGFMAQDGDALVAAPGVERVWETAPVFLSPESAVFDPGSQAIYVSNFDAFNPDKAQVRQAIAKVRLDGTIENPRWVDGLRSPEGLVVAGDRLFVVEPTSVVEVSISRAEIVRRHEAPGARMLNNASLAPNGDLYVSDLRRNAIFRCAEGKCEEWLADPALDMPNGVRVHDGALLVGTTGDGCLKSVDLADRRIRTIACLGPGSIDGVEVDEEGNILVSALEGRLFRVTPTGDVTTLLDMSAVGTCIADFGFIADRNQVVIPTWTGNQLLLYRLGSARR